MTVLMIQAGLLIYYKNKYDAAYAFLNISYIDTFWHPNEITSIIHPKRVPEVSFNRSFVVAMVCCRDVARFLPHFRQNIETILSIFKDYRLLLGESDSADDTLTYLNKWSSTNSKVLTYTYGNLTKTYSTRRSDRIAYCRNHLLNTIREKQWISQAQFLLILDADINANPILSLDSFLTNFHYNLNEWGAMTASQTIRYYDIWALRSTVVNYDCWKEISKYPQYSNLASKIYIDVHTKPIPKDYNLIPVQSAFGGFAIYQTRYLTNCTYDSFDNESVYGKCEHVSFNECVNRNGGKIFVNPAFQNSDGLPT
ncbi:unnamed protein product [Adineta steineri]|uniref:Uncharacterized protein n=2 Tax=Adineta steineri TaxID=433720 RepID=A0A819EC99_9BILA|nr:unnamed protein product [Adineta steineri]